MDCAWMMCAAVEMVITPWVWWSIGAILLGIELMADTNYYLLWAGLSALVVEVVQWAFPAWPVAVMIPLYGASLVLVLVSWHYYMKFNPPAESDQHF